LPRERDAICGAGGQDTAIDGGDIALAEEHIIADAAAATGCRPKGIRPPVPATWAIGSMMM
jgi:hypothetical protein